MASRDHGVYPRRAMLHVFCLGPIEFDAQPAVYAAFVFSDRRMFEPIYGGSVAECFGAVRKRHGNTKTYCEPAHEKVGKRFGFDARELPDELRAARAGIAISLANGDAISPEVFPPVLLELLDASFEFLDAEPWIRFDSDALLHVQIEGAINATWEAVVMGSAGVEYGLGLYPERGSHARVRDARDDREAQRFIMAVSTLGITFDDEPEFAARAVGDLVSLPFVPIALFLDKGQLRPIETDLALVLAASLRAAASDERVGVATFRDLTVQVTLRDAPAEEAPTKPRAQRARR